MHKPIPDEEETFSINGGEVVIHGVNQEEVAKRIVDCVNAMRGIKDPLGFIERNSSAIELEIIRQQINECYKSGQ